VVRLIEERYRPPKASPKQRKLSPHLREMIEQAVAAQCEHDVITDFMIDSVEKEGRKGLSLRGWLYDDTDYKVHYWGTTTSPIEILYRCLNPEGIFKFINEIGDPLVIKILYHLARQNLSPDDLLKATGVQEERFSRALRTLTRKGYLTESKGTVSITAKGSDAIITLMHLAWNCISKPSPEHSQKIAEVIDETLGWEQLEPKNISVREKMKILEETGTMTKLKKKGITKQTIRNYITIYHE
jgi:hypothetical protein